MNLGLRYDLVTGIATLDESKNPNFQLIQAAGAAGKLAGYRRTRELRPDAAGRQEQHPAAHRRRV